MYPNLYYAFKDLFGVNWTGLRFVNSFGFFVAIAFIGAAWTLALELKRKGRMGLLQYEAQKIVIGKPASFSSLLMNFLLGFLLGYKIIGAFLSDTDNPQEFIFSSQGNWAAGILLGALFAFLKWYEKNKQKLAKPEERNIRIWPHDRVGDIVIFAAVFGFAGAKLFHNLENWNELMRDPIGSLLSFSGLTFYGGLICAALAIWYYARKHNIGIWHLNDAAAPGLMLAYAIGRIGCQIAGDGDWGILNSAFISDSGAHVVPATVDQFHAALQANHSFYTNQFGSLEAVQHLSVQPFWGLPTWLFAYNYPHNVISEGMATVGCVGQYCNHLPIAVFPTPFYETVVCLLLFAFLWIIRKKVTTPGVIFSIYLVVNGIERFFIEKIRVNTKYDIFGFHPTQAEIISFLMIVGGVLLIIYLRKRNKAAIAK